MIVNRYVGDVKTPQSEFEKMRISSSLLAAEMIRQAKTETQQSIKEQKNPQERVG